MVVESFLSKPKSKTRKLGVATVVCNACLAPNGVRIGLYYYNQTVLYKCWNPECQRYNRIVINSQPVNLNSKYLDAAQQGVEVHGVENA